jgi:WD40 repeat protein
MQDAPQSEVRLWDTQTGNLQRTLKLEYLTSLTFSRDEKTLVAAHSDFTVKLWDAQSGVLKQTLKGHEHIVGSVALSSNGAVLASGSVDATVKLWSVQSGLLLRTLTGHHSSVRSVAYSPNGRMMAGAGGAAENVRQTGADGIRLWDAASGELMHTLRATAEAVNAIAFSPDSSLLASGSDAYHAPDNEVAADVRLWDTHSGKLLRSLEGHGSTVTSVDFAPNGEILASGSTDKTIRLWNVKTGQLQGTLEGFSGGVSSITFSRDAVHSPLRD